MVEQRDAGTHDGALMLGGRDGEQFADSGMAGLGDVQKFVLAYDPHDVGIV